MLRKRLTTTAAILALAAGAIGLAGCTPEPEGQSVAEACGLVSAELTSIDTEMSDALTKVSEGDLEAAQTTFADLETALAAVAKGIEQEDVQVAFGTIQETVSGVKPIFEALGAEGALTTPEVLGKASADMTDLAEDLNAAGAAFDELCTTPAE